MNDKRLAFKLLGVFLMETLNINGTEFRKTLWSIGFLIAFLKLAFVLVDLIPLFFQ